MARANGGKRIATQRFSARTSPGRSRAAQFLVSVSMIAHSPRNIIAWYSFVKSRQADVVVACYKIVKLFESISRPLASIHPQKTIIGFILLCPKSTTKIAVDTRLRSGVPCRILASSICRLLHAHLHQLADGAFVSFVTLAFHVWRNVRLHVCSTLLARCLPDNIVVGAVGAVAAAFGGRVGPSQTACALAGPADVHCREAL